MKTIKGDLVALALDGQFDVIVHGCNCFCTMGAGIAKTIKQKFPEALKADLETTKGDRSKLGSFSSVGVTLQDTGNELMIVNAYTQFDWRGQKRKADYEAIRLVFAKIKAQFSGSVIAYPAIGAGLAGGNWSIISEIISSQLRGENHVYVEFER